MDEPIATGAHHERRWDCRGPARALVALRGVELCTGVIRAAGARNSGVAARSAAQGAAARDRLSRYRTWQCYYTEIKLRRCSFALHWGVSLAD